MSPFTVPALLAHAATERSGTVAVRDGTRTATFGELRDDAHRVASALRDAGIERGDRVGIRMAKSLDQVVAILATLVSDAILVPVAPNLKTRNIEHITRQSGMRAMICDTALRADVDATGTSVPIFDTTSLGTDSHSSGAGGGRTGQPMCPSASIGSDAAAIIYSSGSTGRPKGIVVTHRNLVDGARITSAYLGTGGEDRIGAVLSLNFDYGLNQLWQCLLTGATLCLHELVFPRDVFAFIAKERITAFPLMPVLITRMFDPRLLRTRPIEDLTCVRYISTSGGVLTERMRLDLETTFPGAAICSMYGLTEAFRSTFLPPDQLAVRPTSIGRAIPDVEILVVDDDAIEVPPGVRGELVHRGGCVAKGYWEDPEATAQRFRELPAFPGERVVFSGDIVVQDDAGYLYFCGRRDAMIKTSGFRVSPTEVEEIGSMFDAIDDCVAFGVPNSDIGAEIVLVYTAHEEVNEAVFREFLRAGLPSHMVPHQLLQIASFPLTPNDGKIDRPAVERAMGERFISDE